MKGITYLLLTRILLIGAVATLIIAIGGGLRRMGWNLPVHQKAILFHGPLMVCGFLGTLITLERAKGIGYGIAYTAPSLTITGSLLLLTDYPQSMAISLITVGSLGLFAILVFITKLQFSLFTVAMALGSLFWIVGNLLWLNGARISDVVFWWMSFLTVTIAAERLGLSRIKRLSTTTKLHFSFCVFLLAIGNIYSLADKETAVKVIGIATFLIALWLVLNDITRTTIHSRRLSRFIAVSLFAGYIWLGLGGTITVSFMGKVPQSLIYDAIVHSVFIGFVFSMIFAHAPIIFPSILGLPVNYTPCFYSHLILLHLSLCVRVAGDLSGSILLRNVGGIVNSIAILIFFVNTIISTRTSSGKA